MLHALVMKRSWSPSLRWSLRVFSSLVLSLAAQGCGGPSRYTTPPSESSFPNGPDSLTSDSLDWPAAHAKAAKLLDDLIILDTSNPPGRELGRGEGPLAISKAGGHRCRAGSSGSRSRQRLCPTGAQRLNHPDDGSARQPHTAAPLAQPPGYASDGSRLLVQAPLQNDGRKQRHLGARACSAEKGSPFCTPSR